MSHLLDTHKLPGIGPGRIKRLKAAGFTSLEELVAAGVDAVAAIPHIPPDVARGAVEAAQAVVGAAEAAPVEAAPVEAAPVVESAPEPAPVVEAAPEPAPEPVEAAPAPEAAPKAAPAPEPTPEPAAASEDDGDDDDGPIGRSKRLLGQLDEALQRLVPGPWSRIRERARRLRS